jgi:hypothetical protein
VLAVGALAGCGGGGGTSTNQGPTGDLHGKVLRGPTSPVCRKGTPCTEPAGGARLAFVPRNGDGTIVVVTKDGSYSVSLAPGIYAVAVSPRPPIGGGVRPAAVRVIAGRTGTVDFLIDTGIR